MREPRSLFLISLGCPKNLVDSESIAALLQRVGFVPAETPDEANLLIVNTCGFIEPAREESRVVLRELADSKQPGQILIAAGCYSQRYPNALAASVPGIDGVIGTRDWMDIVPLVERVLAGDRAPHIHTPEAGPRILPDLPRVALQGASAYLQLADGCSRSCAFCAIPLIKGPSVSRAPSAILADARGLAEREVQEIILIAQDTTSYGQDLGQGYGLIELLKQLTEAVPEVPWIRVMYAYPGPVLEQLAELMTQQGQILPYVDIPLQHAHPDVLRRMRRPANVDGVRRMVARLRAGAPQIAVRTAFIVGYPGETETEFQALLDFVQEMAFDRVGVFQYSHEEGTTAGQLTDDVPPEVKEERRDRLMALQQPISLARNRALIGQQLDVLIEGQDEGLSVGRSYRDAPEIDGLVLVQAALPVGKIVSVRITAALEYDLIGEPLRKARAR
ncbi:MAG: 30S ribosomal protein S12 methylthiotransferase RimO, partial [Anaerolineales bacterium]|nr:30S ribosomal protein S12 methylthiotransferase RimO [Anaerolineales bacterium]